MCFPSTLTNYTCIQWNPPPPLIPEHFRPHLHRKPPIFSHLATLAHQTHNFTPQHTFYNCQQLFQTLPHLLSTSFTSYRAPTHVFSWWILIISEPVHIFNHLPVLAFSTPQTPFYFIFYNNIWFPLSTLFNTHFRPLFRVLNEHHPSLNLWASPHFFVK